MIVVTYLNLDPSKGNETSYGKWATIVRNPIGNCSIEVWHGCLNWEVQGVLLGQHHRVESIPPYLDNLHKTEPIFRLNIQQKIKQYLSQIHVNYTYHPSPSFFWAIQGGGDHAFGVIVAWKNQLIAITP